MSEPLVLSSSRVTAKSPKAIAVHIEYSVVPKGNERRDLDAFKVIRVCGFGVCKTSVTPAGNSHI